jgi:Ser/Thr protein kinase RdoA (MazF antagonist)
MLGQLDNMLGGSTTVAKVNPGTYKVTVTCSGKSFTGWLVVAPKGGVRTGDGASMLSSGGNVATFAPSLRRQMRGTIEPRRGGWVRRRTHRRVRWRAIAMTGIEASASPLPLPGWFGPRASPDDPAVLALIARVARGAGWADIGGEFNLNLRIDAEPPVVLRVHRPWVRRGRVAGLRRLRERLGRTQVRVPRPIPFSGCDLLRVAGRWAEIEEFIDHVQPRPDEDSYIRLFEELGRLHTALKVVWEPSAPEPLDDHRTFGQLRYSVGFTRRRLGPGSEPVVHRMRQLTGELSKLRQEVELPCTPIHGDYKLGNAGELSDGSWVTFDLDFARVRERLYDIAASLHHVAQDGELLEPRRLLDAYESTAAEPLTRNEHRWLPGALALIPLHWAATAGLVGKGIHEAESAMTAAEAWWSRRVELSS